jgi:membrane-associated HD superfamily phosphohydrolase
MIFAGLSRKGRDELAFRLSIIAGILLFLSGTNGAATWSRLGTIVLYYLDFALVRMVIILLVAFASFGGIAVIVGGYLIKRKHRRWGAVVIAAATGSGVISLIANTVLSIATGDLSSAWFFSFNSVGIIVSIAARLLAMD